MNFGSLNLYNIIAENPNISFLVIGIMSNIALTTVVVFIGYLKVSMMSEEQQLRIADFSKIRTKVIVESNSKTKLKLASLQVYLPFYITYLMLVRLYYLLSYNGSFCVIGGIVAYDKYSILNLIQYEFE
jgi:hypothetical protein